MIWKGDCWDNAAMESFFTSLKTEGCARRQYCSRDEARADALDHIVGQFIEASHEARDKGPLVRWVDPYHSRAGWSAVIVENKYHVVTGRISYGFSGSLIRIWSPSTEKAGSMKR